MKSISPSTREEIASRAYSIWEQNGRPASRATEFWVRAEHELQEQPVHAESGDENLGVDESVSVSTAAKHDGSRTRRARASSRPSTG